MGCSDLHDGLQNTECDEIFGAVDRLLEDINERDESFGALDIDTHQLAFVLQDGRQDLEMADEWIEDAKMQINAMRNSYFEDLVRWEQLHQNKLATFDPVGISQPEFKAHQAQHTSLFQKRIKNDKMRLINFRLYLKLKNHMLQRPMKNHSVKCSDLQQPSSFHTFEHEMQSTIDGHVVQDTLVAFSNVFQDPVEKGGRENLELPGQCPTDPPESGEEQLVMISIPTFNNSVERGGDVRQGQAENVAHTGNDGNVCKKEARKYVDKITGMHRRVHKMIWGTKRASGNLIQPVEHN